MADHVVRPSQTAFMQGRNILDVVVILHETVHEIHRKKLNGIILKLDFAKAFDTIEHQAILKILKCKGLDDRWLGWVDSIFSSGTSSILLNGTPGKKFACKRSSRMKHGIFC